MIENTLLNAPELQQDYKKHIKEHKLHTNSNLILIQSRLLYPNYIGPGKWVIFNTRSRKSYLAIGKDSYPPILKILTLCSKNEISNMFSNLQLDIPESQIDYLIKENLLDIVNRPTTKNNCFSSYLGYYHQAVYNYPFNNYYDSDWRAKDRDQMLQYKNIASPPPPFCNHQGDKFPLPEVNKSEFVTSLTNPNEFGIRELALVLKFTFAPIEEFPHDIFGSWIRKTSPSGGARHPTECKIIIPSDHPFLPSGLYYYDNKGHNLIKTRSNNEKDLLDKFNKYDSNGIGFLICSKVERAMWRYREIRSFRPIFIDAGHIIETLSLLLGAFGVTTQITHPPLLQDTEWLNEPELALVLARTKPDNTIEALSTVTPIKKESCTTQPTDCFLTNPFMFSVFDNGFCKAKVIWPIQQEHILTETVFDVLTHSLPSQRGDRDTSAKALLRLFPKLKIKELEELIEKKILLPQETAHFFYKETSLWVNHGWYLSLLAYLDIFQGYSLNSQILSPHRIAKLTYTSSKELAPTLLSRVTTRQFKQNPILKNKLLEILHEASEEKLLENLNLKIFVNCLHIVDMEYGKVCEWNIIKQKLVPIGKVMTQEEVRALTIGQEFAGAGGFTIWLVLFPDLSNKLNYAKHLITLGQIGQRICLAATKNELGVFMTPAVCDDETCLSLQIPKEKQPIFYFFTIGERA
ncbi:MAG: hypothetical protein K0S74_841 [Chlamydiales bacterium]|jgi:hypothetical protein|nr:hypothetical protein [Chlamydiales bacterium]